ncbi:hypothetical protein H0A64_13600 [Alcaligenaceae bacterium]|nr:hypothetical protein [Alcaligenaceae bacterium]
MKYAPQLKPIGVSIEETLALLKILALGDQELDAGKTESLAEVVAKLKDSRNST